MVELQELRAGNVKRLGPDDPKVRVDGWGTFHAVAVCDFNGIALFKDRLETALYRWASAHATGRVSVFVGHDPDTPYYKGVLGFSDEEDAHLFRLSFTRPE